MVAEDKHDVLILNSVLLSHCITLCLVNIQNQGVVFTGHEDEEEMGLGKWNG